LIIDPLHSDGFYNIMSGVIVPRPIAFVSTVSKEGTVNLAPFSFFNVASTNPPTVFISMGRNTETKPKDTLTNIEETGEFVVNVVIENIAAAMNSTAAEYPEDVNEFDIAGLTQTPSQVIAPPRVLESPVNLECRLKQVIPIGNAGSESGLVLGEVILAHIRDDIIDGNRIDQDKLKAVGRLAGGMYSYTRDQFELIRPTHNPLG
jgi:flavin reductase (DIM6/NTAB) family NADH-FMN oxidoreductase RutF